MYLLLMGGGGGGRRLYGFDIVFYTYTGLAMEYVSIVNGGGYIALDIVYTPPPRQ